MKIEKTLSIDAPAERVWKILGPDYVRAGDWASSVYASAASEPSRENAATAGHSAAAGRRRAPLITGAPAAGQTCQTSLGPFTESLTAYDESRMHIAYSATGAKMPGFVRSLSNAFHVTPDGPGRSTVRLALSADIAQPFALLMGWVMRRQFDTVLDETLDDLRVYAETGRPSPRKVKANGSKRGKAARSSAAATPAA